MTKPPPLNIKEDRTPEQLARHGDDPNDIVKRLRETATQWGILRINNPARKVITDLRCSCQIVDHVSDECLRLGKCKERAKPSALEEK